MSSPKAAPSKAAAKAAPLSKAAAKAAKAKEVPAHLREPFQKQITRKQAIMGKLLEDNTMVRVLTGASSTDIVYDPKYESQSHTRNLGAVRSFGYTIGRVDMSKSGTRAGAAGTRPSHWFPTAPPKDDMTRPSSASSGVAFQRQITRKQDVNGKLLENIAMTRFLFGANNGNGQEYYEKAYDSLMAPLSVSHRPRVGSGQHRFKNQVGRLPLQRAGTRAAAQGSFPSYWEPGMGYSDTIPKPTNVANFHRQMGRVDLHLSGMRGAPPKASLAADYVGPSRPQSAMAMLRADAAGAPAVPKRPMTAQVQRPIPEAVRPHIYTQAWDKQLTRDQWTSRAMR